MSLRLVLLLTLPPMAFMGYVVCGATVDYRTARQYDDWWSDQTSLRKFAWYRMRDVVNRPRMFFLKRTMQPERPGVETLQLEVKPKDWERLQNNVAGRWGKWTDGELMLAGERLDVRLRLRGDNSVHWIGEKKSLTLKTEKGEHYKGYRKLGLSLKTALRQFLPQLVAPDFDLLVPRTEVFPIFVNSEYYGIFRLIEAPDESFLRAQRLLPGNVYRADFAGRGEYRKNLPRQAFVTPFAWDRTAENIRPTGPGDAGLYEFIDAINGTSFDEHAAFTALTDHRELARYLAIQLLFGDPYHMDGIHNQLWYEDPASGLLHPIIWDLRFFNAAVVHEERPLNRFFVKLMRDPRIYDGALRAFLAWNSDPSLRDRAVARMYAASTPYPAEYKYEYLRDGQIRSVGHADRMERHLDLNTATLLKQARTTDVAFQSTPAGAVVVLDFLIGARMGGDLLGLDTGLADAAGARVFCDTNLDGEWGPADRLVETRAEAGRIEFLEPEPLLAGCRTWRMLFLPEPIAYRLFLVLPEVLPEGAAPGPITPRLIGRGDGAPLETHEWPRGEPIPEILGFHPWSFERPAPADVLLSGDVHLREDLLIEAGAELVLAPGTRIVLDPDVSIEVRGRVLALGTADQPISVEAAEPGRPWGTFALQGAGAAGSAFEHVRFSGGGGELIGRVEYKGMVCVYHVNGVRFEDCTFAENLRCDDLLNAVLSAVDVRRCEFLDANADSIDFDMTTGEIERCVIRRSGNDGIDLMTCSPRILSTVIDGSGDKGISIGEDSNPLVFDTLITDCMRGIQVKDRSSPLLIDSRIEGCRVGVLQDRKNWRYAASGRARIVGSVIAGNDRDYQGSGGATLTLAETVLGDEQHASAPAWMRAAHGFGAPVPGPAPPREWQRVTPSEVVHELTFRPEFARPSAGWSVAREFERVDTLDDDLVGRLRELDGQLVRRVDWRLDPSESEYLLVVEVAGDDLADAHLTLTADSGLLELPLQIDDDEDTFRYTTLALPPGHYTELKLTATPERKDSGKLKRGRINLHRLSVLRRSTGGR